MKAYLQNGLTFNMKLETQPVDRLNYHTPLTGQVEALGINNKLCNLEVGTTLPSGLAHSQAKARPVGTRRGNLRVQFYHPPHHMDKDSAAWRRHPRTKRKVVHRK